MQFIANGPDIPDALLQAHEEGRVVFFCGAGIAYPSGLPGFGGLVEKIFELVGTTFTEIEEAAFKRGHYDATLDLLEHRLPGQRLAVRRALSDALKPKLRRKGAADTQAALLRLARSRGGSLRLVTTNFDRVFHAAAKRTGQKFQTYAAPMLPIPKNSRWDGLVYLHGLLPEKSDDTALNRLVVTSGDFGLAYLSERWAARFVSELFRNYVVCFVGYSINDPVLRYMMDALAADRLQGETTPQAWAFGSCEAGQESKATIEWETKGVIPILYNVPARTHGHEGLHHTLQAWADTYRDGVQGKEAIVIKHALARPQDSSRQDDFVGRMLWALSDPSGLPAKRFADFNPAPSLDWLMKAFETDRFTHGDLPRFGVPAHAEVDEKLKFSLIHRPASYDRAPRMALASGFGNGVGGASEWDRLMSELGRWLTRHLNDPELVLWIAGRGGQLHHSWKMHIQGRLDYLASLERDGKSSELDEIRLQASNAIPGPMLLVVWRLLLSGRVKSPWRSFDLHDWKIKLARYGLTATLRLELRELLAPRVILKAPIRWGDDDTDDGEPTRLKQLVDWELVLASDHVHSELRELSGEIWSAAMPKLLDDFQQLLRDALDLMSELGGINSLSDRSHWDMPSIEEHWQNRAFREWVCLIELTRDAWLVLRADDVSRAAQLAATWFEQPYPTFKRLALFAAAKEEAVLPDQWVSWLLIDDAWWLWSVETGREVYRLLVLQGKRLSNDARERLEHAILAGPPRAMYRSDMDDHHWNGLLSHAVWLHLAKLAESGISLGEAASARLADLSAANADWKLAANERDEFSHWMSGTSDPDYGDSRNVDIAPRTRSELISWLKMPPHEPGSFYEDTWREVCRTRFFLSLSALRALSREGLWPIGRWRDALQAWAEPDLVQRSWLYASLLIRKMPDAAMQELAHGISWWLEAASKSITCREDTLLELCQRVLALPLDAASGIASNDRPMDQPVTEAINHPVGHVTQALLNLWFKGAPNDNELLPPTIEPIFTQLCDVRQGRFRHGRVLLGSRLIALFRVDRPWTEEHLLPLFSWGNRKEAKAVWEGFLWSPRLYQPLLIAFKSQFLETASHYAELGEHAQQFAAVLTYAALGPTEGYSFEDFRDAIAALPSEGLREAARALSQALEGAGEQREEYWKHRIQVFWKHAWPKARNLAKSGISESLARMVIAARGEFPAALATVIDWLHPIEHSDFIVHLLYESNLCDRFPAEALQFLNAIIANQLWPARELGSCLDRIARAVPQLEKDPRQLRLREYLRKLGR